MKKILQSRWFYIAAGTLMVLAALATQVKIRLPSRPTAGIDALASLRERKDVNLVFILVDTLRADHVSAYGYGRATTPTLTDIASSGIRFAHVQSQSSWTKASMASLWTSNYPVRTGVLRYPHALPGAQRMPAEILKEAGFETIGLYRNGWVANNFGFDQGFDVYIRPTPNPATGNIERAGDSAARLGGSDFDASQAAVGFARNSKDKRFFLYLHYMDVHQYVYEKDSALFGTNFSDVYDNAIHWTDRNINFVLKNLDDMGLLQKSVVVVAADHGEAFQEHGVEGHGRNLYREVTETPLIVMLPFRLDRGVVVDAPVQNVDIWPTLLDLFGLPPLPDAQGRSLVPLIQAAYRGDGAPAGLAARDAFSEIDRTWGRVKVKPDPQIEVTSGQYRFYYAPEDPKATELYDVSADPKETRNLAKEKPDVAEQLSGKIQGYLAAPPAASGAPEERELDEFRLNQLKALGYVVH